MICFNYQHELLRLNYYKEVLFVAQKPKKKVAGFVKLQIPAGKATPAPPVGPALGQHGINIAGFTKEFNERTYGLLDDGRMVHGQCFV